MYIERYFFGLIVIDLWSQLVVFFRGSKVFRGAPASKASIRNIVT